MPNVNCDPAKGVVADSCGVFVSFSKGGDKNAGTKASPFKSINAALAAPKVSVLYACAEEFPEAVTIANGVTIYGGLDCSSVDWPYVGSTKKTVVKAPVDSLAALVVTASAKDTVLRDVHLESVKPSMPGGSSIGVIADQASVDFESCEIVAGDGADGAAGATQMQVAPGADGKKGVDDGCTTSGPVAGGNSGQLTCGADDVGGGAGGQGTNGGTGGPGLDGSPAGGLAPDDGKGGAAQDSMNACKAGHAGAPGTSGQSGSGATGIGILSATGYQSPAGKPGVTSGSPGNGGGGGGGARKCDMVPHAGPSGGGGGSGGCGGAPGNAGGGAGSSFGLVSLKGAITLNNTPISTGKGGTGGVGGDGQAGGNGGQPGGAGGSGACPGGVGGQGGRGGSGGGGLGGHSVAIVIQGGALPTMMGSKLSPGMPGLGGVGGDGDMAAKGGDGLGCATLDFTDAMSCK
jgi:hypothetical protein